MNQNYIYHGDCLDLMKTMDDNSVDLIIADPPYFQIKGDFDFLFKNVDQYIEWCKLWIKECERILKNSGSFYLWGAIGYNKGYALPKIADWIESENLFNINNWITQRNTRGYGSCKKYMPGREELLFMTKKNSQNYTWNTAYTEQLNERKDLGENGKPRTNQYMRCSDVWIDIAEASQSKNQRFYTKDGESFPTVKALKLCDRIINASSNKGDLVFIPFAGSGSEIISCIENQRNFVASEIKKDYIEDIIIKKRLQTKGINVCVSADERSFKVDCEFNQIF